MSAPLSEDAKQDLREIRVSLRRHAVASARRILLALERTLGDVAVHPLRGRLEDRFTSLLGHEVRSMRAESYLVLYRVEPVQIIAILHGARDLETLLSRRVQ